MFPRPTYLPVLSSLYLSNTEGNFSGSESDVELLGAQNQVVLRCLRLYDPQSALISLNRSFDFESDPARKCFIAALAASHGSERAAIYLLDELKKTDGKSVSDVQAALVQGIRYSAPTAGPLVELAKTAALPINGMSPSWKDRLGLGIRSSESRNGLGARLACGIAWRDILMSPLSGGFEFWRRPMARLVRSLSAIWVMRVPLRC